MALIELLGVVLACSLANIMEEQRAERRRLAKISKIKGGSRRTSTMVQTSVTAAASNDDHCYLSEKSFRNTLSPTPFVAAASGYSIPMIDDPKLS